MSLIPQNALASALSAVQRPRNDAATARQAAARNQLRHAEDINALDEKAVDTIGDQGSNGSNSQQEQEPTQQHSEDLVEIASLTARPQPAPRKAIPPATSSLDISA